MSKPLFASAPTSAAPARRAFWITLLVALLATIAVYLRGLQGVFLFDDFSNLPSLGAYGPVDDARAFWRYITSGIADPTGRPLSLLTFLIDGNNWPADPFPFKRTNLLIHLVNGALLALLLRRLGRTLIADAPIRTDLAAVLGAALWLLHPLLVSTTLYVVQREAMLPATFMLLGLLAYTCARERVVRGETNAVWLAGAAIIAATGLAVLSKANGILLPLLGWIVDSLLLSQRQPTEPPLRRRFAAMRAIVLVLPSLMLLGWLIRQGAYFLLHGVGPMRAWTMGERLLTEARVVCEYLALLWLPHPYTAGLFNDAIMVSKGLLSPPTTLASIAFIGALLGIAVAYRRRAPAFTFAVLFYFAGQLLESSVIPLELYYEHRNYLPAMPMFWPLALWLTGSSGLQALRRALAIVLPLTLAAMTFARADLWGNAQEQALMWAEKNPDSPRAQAYAAATERARGRPDLAARRMQRARIDPNEDVQLALNLVGAQCQLGEVKPQARARAEAALRTTRTAGKLYYDWIDEAIREASRGQACAGLGFQEIGGLLAAMDSNPNMVRYAGWRQDNLSLRGTLALAMRDPQRALAEFNKALEQNPDAGTALTQAAQLGAAGYPNEGIAHLDHYDALRTRPLQWSWSMRSVHAWLMQRDGLLQQELNHLRGVLEQDIRDAQTKS